MSTKPTPQAAVQGDEPRNPNLETKDCLDARLIELDLLEQALNTGRDLQVFKLQRLEDLQNRIKRIAPTKSSGKLEEILEQLADIEHQRWADWQKWVHEQCPRVEYDGKLHHLMLSAASYRRWERQIATPYADLTEKEKQSDRDQVTRYWPVIESYIATQTTKLQAEARIDELGGLIPNYDGIGTIGYQYADGSQVSLDVRIEHLEREHKIMESPAPQPKKGQ